jgi:tetratricopeptide (TPR) repeat protein
MASRLNGRWATSAGWKAGWILWLGCGLMTARLAAQDASLTNLMAEGQRYDQQGETQAALKVYLAANLLAPTNVEILCQLAKQYCDSMHAAADNAGRKAAAEKALACAMSALQAAPESPKAHVCAAICYAKNFPYLDNQTRVTYSRQIKAEADRAIALDPNYDLAYHMLGRWHFEVSNMGFFVRSLVRIAYGGLPKASKELAIQNFKKAIELSPNRIIHHLQLARMYHFTDKESLMTDELKKCAVLTPVDMDDKDAQHIARKISLTGKWPEDF